MSILTTRDLSKSFGGIHAVRHVDLALDEGELRCLIGPNGAGKSTVFKLIMGLEKPSAGRIRFDDRDITRLHPFQRVRRGLSMKYQTTRVFQGLRVRQNVDIARSARRRDGDLLDWSLAYFGLEAKLDEPVRELTYAEQHWLEMSLILGNAPRLVLMDEPTGGMTPEESHRTADYVQALHGKGLTVLVVAHDMGFVREIARIVTVMHEGAILRQGSFSEIEHDPEVQRVYLGETHE